MTAPYRDDLAALEARHAALEAEVADRERARDEAARMLAEAKARARNEAIAADVLTGGPARRHRRNTTILACIAATAAVFGGLYFASRKPAQDRREAEVADKFGRLADEMCACVDKACGDDVSEHLSKWAQEMASHPDDDERGPSRRFTDRMSEISKRYVDCYTKLLTLRAPTLDDTLEP